MPEASQESACYYDEHASSQNVYAYVGGDPINWVDPMGYFGLPGAVAGGIVGGIGGGVGAWGNGGNVCVGVVLGIAGGAVVGGSGAWVTTVPGQVGMRAAAGWIGNLLGQAQQVHKPDFSINWGSAIGSAVGGAGAGLIAPAGYGVQFGPGASGILQSAVAGIPGSAVSTTGNIVGGGIGR